MSVKLEVLGGEDVRWKDTVKEYTCMKEVLIEREGLDKQGGCVWIGRGGGSFAVALEDISRESEASETIDR